MLIRGARRESNPDEAAATLSLDDLMAGDKTAGAQERFIERPTRRPRRIRLTTHREGRVAHGHGAATRPVATRPGAAAEPDSGSIERLHAKSAAERHEESD